MINFSLLFMLDRPRASLLNATLAIGVVGIFLIPAMGALSDRIGRRPVYVAGALIGVLGLLCGGAQPFRAPDYLENAA